MSTAASVKSELCKLIDAEKAESLPRFFKTGKGEYGEGDKFLGVMVPDQRRVAKRFRDLPRSEISRLLADEYHECRLTALLILVSQMQRAPSEAAQASIFNYYLKNLDRVNNWDLVDCSAHHILGTYLFQRPRNVLYDLARSSELWRQRAAIVATYYFIKRREFADTLGLAELLIDHPHDLIHKAVGWMLREVGKEDQQLLKQFLKHRYKQMPRTMLRYAIERMDQPTRERYLAGKV